MGCQCDIAQTILDKKADYILALKGNRGTLQGDVKPFVDEQKAVEFQHAKVSRDKTVDGDHGRVETRQITVTHEVEWLQERHDWPGLKSVVVVERTGEVGGKIDREMRLYITSLVLLADQIGPMIRGHWMIENGLHWVLDMIFRDGEWRVRTGNTPANFATIKHKGYNLMRRAATRDSMRLRRKAAAWDDEFLASLIAA
jgi:predicted transposase YbfD/YdcC